MDWRTAFRREDRLKPGQNSVLMPGDVSHKQRKQNLTNKHLDARLGTNVNGQKAGAKTFEADEIDFSMSALMRPEKRFGSSLTLVLLVVGMLQGISPDPDSLISLGSLRVLCGDLLDPGGMPVDDSGAPLVCRPVQSEDNSNQARSHNRLPSSSLLAQRPLITSSAAAPVVLSDPPPRAGRTSFSRSPLPADLLSLGEIVGVVIQAGLAVRSLPALHRAQTSTHELTDCRHRRERSLFVVPVINRTHRRRPMHLLFVAGTGCESSAYSNKWSLARQHRRATCDRGDRECHIPFLRLDPSI